MVTKDVDKLSRDAKKLNKELIALTKKINAYKAKKAKRKEAEKKIIAKLQKDDEKAGIKSSMKEYRKEAKNIYDEREINRKMSRLIKNGYTPEDALKKINSDTKLTKRKYLRDVYKRNIKQYKLEQAKKANPNTWSAPDDAQLRRSVGKVSKMKPIERKSGRYSVKLEFHDVDYDKLDKNKVFDLIKKGHSYTDAIAIAHLDSKQRLMFGNKAPGVTHRNWTQGEIYQLIKAGDKTQASNEKAYKNGKLKQLPQDDIGKGNEENLFRMLRAQGAGQKVYRPATFNEREAYSSMALLTSLDKMLTFYFGDDDELKDFIMKKANSKGRRLREYISHQAILSNMDFANLFGYNLGSSLMDYDQIADSLVNLCRALGIDVNAPLNGGAGVGERAYALGGLNKDSRLIMGAKLAYKGLKTDTKRAGYKTTGDKKYKETLAKYEDVRRSRTI